MKKGARRVDFVLVLLAVALLAAWQVTRLPLGLHTPNAPVGTPRPANALVGTWQGQMMDVVTFRDDGTLEWTYGNPKYGRRTGTYRVDFSQRPAELDILYDDTALNNTYFLSCEITSQGALRTSGESCDPAKHPRTFGPDPLVFNRLLRGGTPSST